ncbi:SGNH/GDSL hydrolase family protein [Bacillus sp. Bva_UNVM-123]|uniref:SGNH/GDSL hydrolase family protein n=1 Tax=Bacillus sp. Bva_UNVM-123 TaxID=2829798 RepID=UPI00391F8C8F
MRLTVALLLICTIILSSCTPNSSSHSIKLNQYKKSVLMEIEHLPVNFIPKEMTIVSVGDSLTEGVGDSTKRGGYVPYLKEMLEMDKGISAATFYNFGVKGNRSDQLLNKLGTKKVKKAVNEADIVIVTIGGNDVMKVVRENFSNLNLKAFEKQNTIYKRNLADVIQRIRQENENCSIVLVGLYNPFTTWFANVHELNEIINDWNQSSEKILAEYSDAYFVKVDDIFQRGGVALLYTDYFHPNDKGYELMAERVHATISTDVLNQPFEQSLKVENEENEENVN